MRPALKTTITAIAIAFVAEAVVLAAIGLFIFTVSLWAVIAMGIGQ